MAKFHKFRADRELRIYRMIKEMERQEEQEKEEKQEKNLVIDLSNPKSCRNEKRYPSEAIREWVRKRDGEFVDAHLGENPKEKKG